MRTVFDLYEERAFGTLLHCEDSHVGPTIMFCFVFFSFLSFVLLSVLTLLLHAQPIQFSGGIILLKLQATCSSSRHSHH